MIHLVTFEDFSVNHFVDNSEPRGENVGVLLLLQVVQVDHRQVRRNVGPQFHATPTLGPAKKIMWLAIIIKVPHFDVLLT